MSRTYKDRPAKIRHARYMKEAHERELARKTEDTEWHWLQSTPSWWTNLYMNRPLRRQAQQWERDVQKVEDLEELEDIDKPNVSKKPHKYYW